MHEGCLNALFLLMAFTDHRPVAFVLQAREAGLESGLATADEIRAIEVRRAGVEGVEEGPRQGGEQHLPAQQGEERGNQAILDIEDRCLGRGQRMGGRALDPVDTVSRRGGKVGHREGDLWRGRRPGASGRGQSEATAQTRQGAFECQLLVQRDLGARQPLAGQRVSCADIARQLQCSHPARHGTRGICGILETGVLAGSRLMPALTLGVAGQREAQPVTPLRQPGIGTIINSTPASGMSVSELMSRGRLTVELVCRCRRRRIQRRDNALPVPLKFSVRRAVQPLAGLLPVLTQLLQRQIAIHLPAMGEGARGRRQGDRLATQQAQLAEYEVRQILAQVAEEHQAQASRQLTQPDTQGVGCGVVQPGWQWPWRDVTQQLADGIMHAALGRASGQLGKGCPEARQGHQRQHLVQTQVGIVAAQAVRRGTVGERCDQWLACGLDRTDLGIMQLRAFEMIALAHQQSHQQGPRGIRQASDGVHRGTLRLCQQIGVTLADPVDQGVEVGQVVARIVEGSGLHGDLSKWRAVRQFARKHGVIYSIWPSVALQSLAKPVTSHHLTVIQW